MEFRWEMSKDSGKDTGVGLTCDAGPSASTTHSSQQKAGQRDPLALSLHGPGCVLLKTKPHCFYHFLSRLLYAACLWDCQEPS